MLNYMCDVPDYMFDFGIDKFYVEGEAFYYKETLIEEHPLKLEEGELVECLNCKEYKKHFKQGLCRQCYKKLYNKAKFNIDNTFKFNDKEVDCNNTNSFKIKLEKYHVYHYNNIYTYKRDLSLLPKGYQMFLPFEKT